MVPAVVYETLFLLAWVLVPVALYQSGLAIYIVSLLLMYLALMGVRKYQNTKINVKGKSVFISGCDTGFGHDTALQLNAKGFRVFAGCLFPDGDGANALKEACPDNLSIVPLDVTKDSSVENAVSYVRDHLGDTCLWGLVNNAGVHCVSDVEVTSMKTYERVFGVNTFGMMRIAKAFLPLIRKSKGRIVIVSSIASQVHMPSASCYAASKCALEGFGDSLRMEMVKFGVKVSIIQPCAFGGNTSITVGDNIKRLYSEAETTWESSSEDVKKVYGKSYTKSLLDSLLITHKDFSCSSTKPVTDAIEESLLSSSPVYRKVVHGGPFFVDPLAIIGILTNFLPQEVLDSIYCKIAGHTDTSKLQGFAPQSFLTGKEGANK